VSNPEYPAGYRIQQRGAQESPPEPLRLPAPLNRLPWDLAKDEFGPQGTDFIAVMGALLVRVAKDQIRSYAIESTALPSTLPLLATKDQIPPVPY
jgi:hypothetical protein